MHNTIQHRNPQNTFISVRVRVVLGNPALQCARYGVCEVDALPPMDWEAFVPAELRLLKAALCYSPKIGLQFSFPRDGMLPATYAAFFSSGSFLVESPLVLPPDICHLLGAAPGLRIDAGVYPLESSETAIGLTLSPSLQPVLVGQR